MGQGRRHILLGEVSVLLHSLQARSQLGIGLQQPPNQILAAPARDTVVHLAVMVVADSRVGLLERGGVERRLPHQQGIKYAAQRPNIRLVAVRLLVQYFRGDVVRRAAYRPANANDTAVDDAALVDVPPFVFRRAYIRQPRLTIVIRAPEKRGVSMRDVCMFSPTGKN